jgi:cell shape-determining protein MreD
MIKSFALVMLIYMLVAAALQMAVLPSASDALPPLAAAFMACPLLALAGVLAGMLRGEVAGMATSLVAALLYGFSTDAAYVGPSLLSYGVTAFLAGLMARYFRLNGLLTRLAAIGFLLALESVLWSLTRMLFWHEARVTIPLGGIVTATVLGAVLYAMLAPSFKANFQEND